MVHRRPPGAAAPAGACFAHSLLSEDLGVNGVLAARPPLALSTWFGRTGLSEVPPLVEPVDWRAWACPVRVDLTRVWRYARAVYASTDAYIAALPDDALDVGAAGCRRASSARSCSPCRFVCRAVGSTMYLKSANPTEQQSNRCAFEQTYRLLRRSTDRWSMRTAPVTIGFPMRIEGIFPVEKSGPKA